VVVGGTVLSDSRQSIALSIANTRQQRHCNNKHDWQELTISITLQKVWCIGKY
jgi:hypothetical protein